MTKARVMGIVVAVTVVALTGCASRTGGHVGAADSSPSFGTIKSGGPPSPDPSVATYYLQGSCAKITSLASVIKSSGTTYTWAFGRIKATGRRLVADSGPRAGSEVFTGFTFTPTATLYGVGVTSPTTVWTPGGTTGSKATTTDSTSDSATSPDGTALVTYFASDNLNGRYEFSALPATGTTFDLTNVGCWLSTTPLGTAAQARRLPLRSRQSESVITRGSIVIYHDGQASTVTTVRVRRLLIKDLQTVLR